MAEALVKVGRGLYSFFVYAFMAFGLGAVILAITIGFVASYIDQTTTPKVYVLMYMGFCLLIGVGAMYLRWRTVKWREENPELYAQQQAARQERQRLAEQAAATREPNPIWSGLWGMIEGAVRLVIGIVILAVVAVVLYVVYNVVSGLPITVAIIIGACIIGLAIIAVARA